MHVQYLLPRNETPNLPRLPSHAVLVLSFTRRALDGNVYTLNYVMRVPNVVAALYFKHRRDLPYICSHSSWIKSKQGANQRSIITKANIQKALSVSALLRHPLPLQPPSLALVLHPSLHPTPPPLSLLLALPQMHFLHFSLFHFFSSSLFLSSSLHSI